MGEGKAEGKAETKLGAAEGEAEGKYGGMDSDGGSSSGSLGAGGGGGLVGRRGSLERLSLLFPQGDGTMRRRVGAHPRRRGASGGPSDDEVLEVGAAVEAQFEGGDDWFTGTVARVHRGRGGRPLSADVECVIQRFCSKARFQCTTIFAMFFMCCQNTIKHHV